MKQNKYDDNAFFRKYSQMDRSVKGLEGAGEWKTLERLLPDFRDKDVLDLGCGFGTAGMRRNTGQPLSWAWIFLQR